MRFLAAVIALVAISAQAQTRAPGQDGRYDYGRPVAKQVELDYFQKVGLKAVGTSTFVGGAVTSPITFADGTVGAPSIAFTSEADGTGTGWYLIGANNVGLSINGIKRHDYTATAVTFALNGSNLYYFNFSTFTVAGIPIAWNATGNAQSGADTGLSRIAAGVVGVGTGAQGSVAGTIQATSFKGAANIIISGTAPTLASGGCTTPTAVTSNGTAAFSVGVGTSCSGSQPLVFTLPAAATGWQCHARNATNAATSVAAQSSAVSTTSVTITNYARTTGLAAAWTDSDVVVVSCMGY